MASFTGLVSVECDGIDGVGNVSAPGVQVGDVILAIYSSDGIRREPHFDPEVQSDDYLSKTASSDLSSLTLRAVLLRKG